MRGRSRAAVRGTGYPFKARRASLIVRLPPARLFASATVGVQLRATFAASIRPMEHPLFVHASRHSERDRTHLLICDCNEVAAVKGKRSASHLQDRPTSLTTPQPCSE